MPTQLIRLAHSPDSDDAFMFFGLATGAVDPGPFEFEHILRDIQTLNEWAQLGKLEVTAVSVHAYAYLHERYALLGSGASMGGTELAEYVADVNTLNDLDDLAPTTNTGAHGPLLVAGRDLPLGELAGRRIAVPGEMTTAFLTLRLALGDFDYEVFSFDEIVPAILAGRVDAGLIIHEGQLTYRQQGLCCLLDLGQWWFDQTSLPLPLGCNVIRRDLGTAAMRQISGILKNGIAYSLTHRREALDYALQFGRGLDAETADQFVGMYVNRWTLDYGPVGRQALRELLSRAAAAGISPAAPQLDFV